jgi:hydrogenase-4 component E
MTYLLIAYLMVALVPLFVAAWRTSLLGLSLQGLLMGWMAFALSEDLSSLPRLALLAELILVRGILVPAHLYRVLIDLKTPRRSDVIPANLLFWTIVGVLVVLAFRFAANVMDDEEAQTHLAVAAAALMMGLLVLSSQTQPVSQLFGVLRIENAIALFELSSDRQVSLPVQVWTATIFVATVLVFGWFLRRLAAADAETAAGPVL